MTNMTKIENRDILINVKRAAKNKGIPIENLSQELGKTKSYISSAFSKSKGLVSLELILGISDKLDVDINQLLEKRD